jgi:predicted nucleotidyltransferase
MKYGLKEETVEKIKNVFSGYTEVQEVILFGSRAKGNYKPGSDIDLTVKGKLSASVLNQISLKLDDLYLPYTFDLSFYNHIDNQDLIDHINRVGILFYQKTNN